MTGLSNSGTNVGENIIGAPKMRNNFWYPVKMVIFQICDKNNKLQKIAPHLVIALPTLR